MRVAILTNRTWNDAGLLREYFTARGFGKYLEFGGTPNLVFRALDMAKRIAVLAGISLEKAIEDLKADYAASEE